MELCLVCPDISWSEVRYAALTYPRCALTMPCDVEMPPRR